MKTSTLYVPNTIYESRSKNKEMEQKCAIISDTRKDTHDLYSSNILFRKVTQNNTISTGTSRSRSSNILRFNAIIYRVFQKELYKFESL
jgi:hypothetical protein